MGNELTLHQTKIKLPRERHDVDMGNVPVPHFGVHLKKEVFEHIKSNLESKNIVYRQALQDLKAKNLNKIHFY